MSVVPREDRLHVRAGRWAKALGIDPRALPDADRLEQLFETGADPCRPGAEPRLIAAWERRHGFRLPRGLSAWLRLSNGFYRGGPLVHPVSAIGPMIPFARMAGLIVQPESWFELGNPGEETVCIDLAYTWPGGDHPIFTSGDDLRGSPPRLIAPSFEAWFLRLLHEGGREYWFDPSFVSLGDPWREHRRRTPPPPLPAHLRPLAPRLRPHLGPDADDRSLAASFGISRGDVEILFRHLQHEPPELVGP
jgi:hypothetical protein